MLSYIDTQNAMHTRGINFSLQEYLFVVQVVFKEDVRVAYASTFDTAEFNRNIGTEDEEEYLSRFKHDADNLLETFACRHLHEYISQELQSYVQDAASNLKDYKFTGSDVRQLLSNLLHNRSQELDEASVRDIISLIKGMYESGALDSDDNFNKHFITVPPKYNTLCPHCNREGYAVAGLDFRCEFCHNVCKWDEAEKRYYPQSTKL